MSRDRYLSVIGILAITAVIAFSSAWLVGWQFPWAVSGQIVQLDGQDWQAIASDEIQIEPSLSLGLSNPIGTITVQGWDSDEINVHVVRKARAATTTRAQALLDQITITNQWSSEETQFGIHVPNSSSIEQVQVDLVVRVPFDQILEIQAAIGSIDLKELRGKLDVRAKIGSIEGSNLSGKGAFSAEMGAIRIYDSHFEQYLYLTSAMGSIDFQGTPATITTVDTQMGAITLELNRQNLYELRAETSMGSIRTQIPFHGNQTERALDGLLGHGTQVQARLELNSRLGSIQLQ